MKTINSYSFILLLILLTGSLSGQVHSPQATDPVVTDQQAPMLYSDCKAAFSYEPDSLTSSPYIYHFKDLSTGNITSWSWDFGDGSVSTEQYPTHQYEGTGTYSVCLKVANLNDTLNCSDQICLELTTLEYYSLGGLVYAGEYPLNNPVIAGDTGIASLYRIVDNQIVFVEDQYFQDYGYYWFGYLYPADYMVKIALTEGSAHYKDYFTTYFGDIVTWTKAELIKISGVNQYEAEIHLVPVSAMAAGTGIIRGYVSFEQDPMLSFPPMHQTNVILADKDHQPLIFTHPNSTGYFEFSGVPFETYYLLADATGKPASTVKVTLTDNEPLVEGINLTVFGSNPNFIPEKMDKGVVLTNIYPNPVSETLNARLYSGISASLSIKVIDISGKIYYSVPGQFEEGFNEITIPTQNLPQGLYLLVVQPLGNYLPVTTKFMKI